MTQPVTGDLSTYDRLLSAAKELIWEHGVDSTSPADLLEASGVGHGSLYHHFRGKSDWAGAAIASLAADLGAETAALLDGPEPGLDRLAAYLSKPRTALAGCRLGRLAFDPAVVAAPGLAVPLRHFSERLDALLTAAAADARAEGELAPGLEPSRIAATVAATVQGGYVTARMSGREDAMTTAIAGLLDLLRIDRPTATEEAHR